MKLFGKNLNDGKNKSFMLTFFGNWFAWLCFVLASVNTAHIVYRLNTYNHYSIYNELFLIGSISLLWSLWYRWKSL